MRAAGLRAGGVERAPPSPPLLAPIAPGASSPPRRPCLLLYKKTRNLRGVARRKYSAAGAHLTRTICQCLWLRMRETARSNSSRYDGDTRRRKASLRVGTNLRATSMRDVAVKSGKTSPTWFFTPHSAAIARCSFFGHLRAMRKKYPGIGLIGNSALVGIVKLEMECCSITIYVAFSFDF